MAASRVIGIASGCFWRFNRSRNRDALIQLVAEAGVEAIELTFYGVGSLNRFVLSDSSKRALEKSKFISIHAPDFRRIKKKRPEMESCLSQLETLYHSIGADCILFHPDSIDDYKIFKQFSFNASIENLDKKGQLPSDSILRIMADYPDLGFCLDVSHAYSWSEGETSYFVEKLGKRLSHIHVSGSDGENCHLPLRDSDERFLDSLSVIKPLRTPLILEVDIVNGHSDSILRDLAYLRTWESQP